MYVCMYVCTRELPSISIDTQVEGQQVALQKIVGCTFCQVILSSNFEQQIRQAFSTHIEAAGQQGQGIRAEQQGRAWHQGGRAKQPAGRCRAAGHHTATGGGRATQNMANHHRFLISNHDKIAPGRSWSLTGCPEDSWRTPGTLRGTTRKRQDGSRGSPRPPLGVFWEAPGHPERSKRVPRRSG